MRNLEILTTQTTVERMLTSDTMNRIGRALELIPYGSAITLEGPPIYLSKDWDFDHEIGYNGFLPFVYRRLVGGASSIQHVVLIDDYSEESRLDAQTYISKMKLAPDVVVRESQLVQAGLEQLERSIRDGRTFVVGDAMCLSGENQPIIRTKSGRIGCALLDALFQQSKGSGWHVIVHPRMFRGQQRDMRVVLRMLEDIRRPLHLLNIFTINTSLSQVFHTDIDGVTEEIRI